jgi:hypothetical protein
MMRNFWLFLREIRWLAVLAVLFWLAALILIVFQLFAGGLVVAIGGLIFATLAQHEP